VEQDRHQLKELQKLGEEYAQELVSALSPEIFTQLQHHQLRGDP
jgi:hypothetical protein